MYQERTLKVLNSLPALIATGILAACEVAHAAGATQVFSYPNGFAGATNAILLNSAIFNGSVIQLTGPQRGNHQAGSAYYKTRQNIHAFTTDFTFQIDPTAYGFTFCVQNKVSGADADANCYGYGQYNVNPPHTAISSSMAIAFDPLAMGETVASPKLANTATMYLNGGPYMPMVPLNDLNPIGINLHSNHVISAHIVYDGSLLTMLLRDSVAGTQGQMSWPVDIPAATRSDSAWVGFTAGTIPNVTQDILTWDFYEGCNTRLATPTFSVASGLYASAQTVTISGPAGATTYYTTNRQQPTAFSIKYTGPITVSSSEVIQAVATDSGYTDSYIGVGDYQIGPAGTPIINMPNGFTNDSNLIALNGSALFNGSAIQLTDATLYGEAASAWYVVPVNVQSFTTNFTMQILNPMANGMTFCIQNQPPASSYDSTILVVSGGPTALGYNQPGLGYSGSTAGSETGGPIGILNSVAVIFDIYNGSGDLTGLYTNGAMPEGSSIDMTSSGLRLHSGNPLNVTLAYNGTTLTMTITDSVTKASYSHSWPIDIPTTVGGNTAYVGFTASTGGQNANQYIQSWTYAVPPSQAIHSTSSLQPSSSQMLRMVNNRLVIFQKGQSTFELFNLDGRCVLKERIAGNTAINMCSLAKGAYSAMLTSSEGTSIQRIIVE